MNNITINTKYEPLFLNKNRYTILAGGRASGKSFVGILYALTESFKKTVGNILITRYTLTSANVSIIPDFLACIQMLNCEKSFKITKDTIVNLTTGNTIYFKGIKASSGLNTANLKSLSNISLWISEESEEIPDYETFNKINYSIRSKKFENKVILILNPASKTHWIHEHFYVDKRDDATYIQTTYLDNIRNISQSVLDDFERMKLIDLDRYNKVLLGFWGNINSNGLVYNKFNESKIINNKYNPNHDLHISFDFNTNPYCACIISQIYKENDKTIIKIIDEITLRNSTFQETCEFFKNKYISHQRKLYITGDASGRNANAALKKNENFFTLALNYLKIFNPILQVPIYNPAILERIDFINSSLSGLFEYLIIEISPNCKELIKDFENTKLASDGKKSKEKGKVGNVTIELFGHTSDAFDYLCVNFNSAIYNKFLTGNLAQKPVTIKRSINKSNHF